MCYAFNIYYVQGELVFDQGIFDKENMKKVKLDCILEKFEFFAILFPPKHFRQDKMCLGFRLSAEFSIASKKFTKL